MAIGFEYTLSVDEQSSLTELNKFIQAIGDLQVSLSLDLDYDNCMEAISKLQSEIRTLDTKMAIQINTFEIDETDLQAELYRKSRDLKLLLKVEFDDMALATQDVESPTEKIKEKAERDVVLIQDSVKKMLNNLNAQMQKANISSDIIDVDSIERSIEELSLSTMKFDEIKLRAREIKNEISGWQQAIRLQNNLLVETSTQAKQVRDAMGKANEAFKDDGGARELTKSLGLYERRLNIQKESIKMSRQFKEASDDVRESLLTKLDAMRISGNTIKELGQSYQEASISIREMKSSLKAQHIAENGYAFNNLAESVKGLAAQYLTLEAAMDGVKAVFSNVKDYALELDNAYTDVAISMDITKSEFDGWVDTATKIARANGITTGSVMDMVKIYAQAGQSLEDIQKKLEGTAAIQNITQWDADQTTAVVNSIINQFDLAGEATSKFGEDSAAAIEYFGDRLVYLSNNLSMDNVAAIQEMASAIDDAGSVIHNAGGSMEWYMAITGKLAETTNMTGSEIGAAMRMITARTLRQGEAVEAMGESAEDMEFKMAKAEDALSQIGVSIRGETADELLNIEEILGKVANAWDKMSDSQQQSVAEAMAGTQRSSVFQALMNEYQAIQELTGKAMYAQGDLYEANEVRATNLEAAYNKLKDTYNNLCRSLMDSESLKSLIESFDSLLQIVGKVASVLDGNLLPVLGALVAMFATMHKQSLVSFFAKLTGSLVTTNAATGALTISFAALKSVMGIGGVIGLGIFALQKWGEHVEQEKQRLDSMSDAVEDFKKKFSDENGNVSIGTLVDEYKQVNKELEDASLNSDERAEKEQRVIDLTNQLSAASDTYKSILENQNLELDEQIQALEKASELEKKKATYQLLDDTDMSKGQIKDDTKTLTSYSGDIDYYDTYIAELERLLEANQQQQMANNGNQAEMNRLVAEEASLKEKIQANDKLRIKESDDFVKAYERLVAYQEAGQVAEELGIENTREQLEILEEMKPIYEEILGIKQETAATDTNGDGDNSGLEGMVQTAEQAQAKVDELNKTYATTIDQLREASDLSQQVADGFESMDLSNLLNSEVMDGFTGSINNAADVTEHLKNKMQELQDKAYETAVNMQLQNDEAWSNIVNTTGQALNIQAEDMGEYTNILAGYRQVDLDNATSASNAEAQSTSQLLSGILSSYSQVTNSKAGYRKTDMGNVVKFLNSQGVKEAQTVNQISSLWADFYAAKKKAINQELGSLGRQAKAMEGFRGDPTVQMNIDRLNAELNALEAANGMVTNYFNNVGGTFKGIADGLGQAVTSAGKVVNDAINSAKLGSGKGSGKGSGSSGGKGSSGKGSSGSTEKEVADLELAIDRYYEYNDAITDVENKLESLRAKREQITDRDKYKKSLEDEIDLINEQIKGYKNLLKEQQKEQNEIKKVLSNNGFKFDADGDITNYAKQLQTLQKKANKLSGDSKEAAIAQVEALADLIERYNELHDDIIPGTNLEMEDLKNTIIGLNQELEEQLEVVDDLWDRYYNLSVQIAKVDHALNVNRKKQENAETDEERIKLIEEEINLLKQKQKLTQQNKYAAEQEAKTLQDQLDDYGVKFGSDGSIANYDQVMQALQNRINNSSGTEREEAEKAAETLADLVEKYTQLQSETIPGLEEEWLDYADAIGEAEESIEDIYKQQKEAAVDAQKDVADAYEYYLTKRYNKLKEALQKEQEAYNKAYEEETFDRTLNEQQQVLNEIAQQIAIYERDTSAAGRARLEQLKQEYAEQQAAINDIVRENEHEKANENFEDEAASLDEELAELLAPENLIKVVNDAIASGFITIGDEVMSLDVLMTNWMDETGDGLYVLGSVLKTELLDNLKNARDIVNELGLGGTGIDMNTGIASLLQLTNPGGANSQQASVTFSAPLLYVEGNVDQDVADQITTQLQQLEQQIYKNIAEQLK